MEMQLAELFIAAARTADPKTAENVFWSVNSLEVRIAMTNAAIKTAFATLSPDSELPSLWAEIAAELPTASRRRNELAHGSWQGLGWLTKRGTWKDDQYFAPYIGKATAEARPHGTKSGPDPRPKKRLYEVDLEARIQEFAMLEAKVMHLTARLRHELHAVGARKQAEGLRQWKEGRP